MRQEWEPAALQVVEIPAHASVIVRSGIGVLWTPSRYSEGELVKTLMSGPFQWCLFEPLEGQLDKVHVLDIRQHRPGKQPGVTITVDWLRFGECCAVYVNEAVWMPIEVGPSDEMEIKMHNHGNATAVIMLAGRYFPADHS